MKSRNRNSDLAAERDRLLAALVKIATLGGKSGDIAEHALAGLVIARLEKGQPIPTGGYDPDPGP